MEKTYDREKLLDLLFDADASKILSELEHDKQTIAYLAEKSKLSEESVLEKLSPLIEYGFVLEETINGNKYLQADARKLASVIENDENFGSAIDGLTKLDSYLN